MHILVVNDDGPPSTHSSPYVHSLVRELQAAGHLVSVCLPDVQRSWIGKAHIIGQTIEPSYYRPPPLSLPPAGFAPVDGEADNAGTVHARPFAGGDLKEAPEEWVLVNGTPASCVQIGLYHVFRERPAIDLVVSGPNYGRNTTAVFALSSGTLGGALEGATCNKPAIALSYAFFDRNHDRDIIGEASKHSVRVIEALYKQWPKDRSVDLYSVNVPLVAGVSTHKTVYASILQNYWRGGGCFAAEDAADHQAGPAAGPAAAAVGADVEEEIRKAEEPAGTPSTTSAASSKHGPITHRHFKWQPQFTDVYKSVDEAPPGNDGWAVREGLTSITPLKANFWQAATELHKTEFQLDTDTQTDAKTASSLQGLSLSETAGPEYTSDEPLYALVAYEDAYVQPIILDALKALVPDDRLRLLAAAPGATLPTAEQPVSLKALLGEAGASASAAKVLQITPYEVIDFDYAASHSKSAMINSYMIRKALIRKHFLAGTVDQWVAKRPESVLRAHVKRTDTFEVDYAEFLDDALVESFDLRASLDENEGVEDASDRQWWILKPSMSDRGQGIRLFSTLDELQAIFDGWEEDNGEIDSDDDHNDAVAAADLRHFVAQPYIHPPLLLPGTDGRKFHIRVYVLCIGALKVYVHRDMLALFAAKPYAAPWEGANSNREDGEDGEGVDLAAHLTNTCLQDEADKGDSVRKFWDLQDSRAGAEGAGLLAAVFDQICRVTGEVFEAAAVAAPIHFQALPHAFEVFGLDFLVSEGQGEGEGQGQGEQAGPTAWLLEVNAFPDFRQTGTGLQEVVAQFWADALRLVVREIGGGAEKDKKDENTKDTRLVLVKDVDLGRR